MRKFAVLVPLFVIGFGAAFGVAVLTPDPAMAVPMCNPNYCLYELYCSPETGPLCTHPEQPYYLYAINGFCRNDPLGICQDKFVGCCAGEL
jgi:hypothetical protein